MRKRERYSVSEKTGIYGVKLGQNPQFGYHAVAMASDPNNEEGESFQSLALHCVPFLKGDEAEGGRFNLTFRTTSPTIQNPALLTSSTKVIHLTQNCWINLWDDLFTPEENTAIQACLSETIASAGVADETIVFGKKHTNHGRMVVDMADKPNFQYRYAGKTVTGIEWPPLIRDLVLPRIVPLFGGGAVEAETIWAHLVYYPTPECKLGWHDDGEDGINPHFILSLTFLEHPEKPRTFQVRLKKKPK